MFKRSLILFVVFITIGIYYPLSSSARVFITDWYIKDFESEIQVNKDSSLLITEKITADCDNLPNKHGIFRILPTQINTTEGIIKTPIKLISITDFNDKKLKYSTITDSVDHTVTWKIGDPNKTVTGVNYYKITYKVKNAIRFGNTNFDELYWNLNGNFWEIETDNFVSKIIFPSEITQQNSEVDYYTGFLGNQDKSLAKYEWLDNNTLQFSSTQTLIAKQGITASITFPKNIFLLYKPNFIEKYGNNLWFLLPILVFIICFIIWWEYGKDPKINKTIIPEFEIPENLAPIEMGMLITDGKFKNEFISASILNLAVKGDVAIKEIEKKWLMGRRDFELTLTKEIDESLNTTEQLLKEKLFKGTTGKILLSSLKKRFYQDIPKIKKSAVNDLVEKELVTKKSFSLQKILGISIIVIFFLLYLILHINRLPWQLFLSFPISLAIISIFASVMPKRTEKGTELLWKVNGFKLYMETAEKYRQQFYEKENIFEKLLPYAIVFGMTKLWIRKMKDIYGEKYFETYHPVWFVGTNLGSFNVDSFTSAMNDISSSISSSAHGGSGAGGGGFSGGGGGGGGGGGW
jgi:uncharacterized membrane protein YgcG